MERWEMGLVQKMETEPESLEIVLEDEEATAALASSLAGLARAGDVFALWGDLGAGKTVFARAFVNALSPNLEEVPSPTFTLVQVYDTPICPIHHFDLYRLEHPIEAFELGIEDAFAEGVSVIEWPERLGGYIPGDRLDLTLSHLPENASASGRHAVLSGFGSWARRIKELNT